MIRSLINLSLIILRSVFSRDLSETRAYGQDEIVSSIFSYALARDAFIYNCADTLCILHTHIHNWALESACGMNWSHIRKLCFFGYSGISGFTRPRLELLYPALARVTAGREYNLCMEGRVFGMEWSWMASCPCGRLDPAEACVVLVLCCDVCFQSWSLETLDLSRPLSLTPLN